MEKERSRPQFIWTILKEIYAHPDNYKKNQGKIHQRIKKWLIKRSNTYNIPLKIQEDSIGNIFVRKPALSGCENYPPILLQAHYDIYDKKESSIYDFQGSSISFQEKWIEMIGTPIFDDSIVGVALILAVLINKNEIFEHGPIEALFTVKRDDRFVGALNLDVDYFNIQSKFLLNFDSVDLGAITNGTAGCAEFLYSKKATPIDPGEGKYLTFYKLSISGLKGGELGSEIHFFRANAIKLIARALSSLSEHMQINLADWSGGDLYRFIPRKSTVIFAVHTDEEFKVEQILKEEKGTIIKKYRTFTEYGSNLEPNLCIQWEKTKAKPYFSKKISESAIALANLIPHGLSRSSSVENEFGRISNNFAKVETTRSAIRFHSKSRGDNAPEFKAFNRTLIQLGDLGGWKVKNDYTFPVWVPQKEKEFLNFVKHKYEDILQKPIRIDKLYWVLEPGIIAKQIPQMQALSIGPTEIGVFPENYKVSVYDIQILFRLLRTILKNLNQISM
ncbi:peptidase dimerization domain-containing protein [Candidatus Lokiarchaeum ossiferum]